MSEEETRFVALRLRPDEFTEMSKVVTAEQKAVRETLRSNDIRKLPPLARIGLRILAAAVAEPGECMICGCTKENCVLCIEKTGAPCEWVNPQCTLCSACLES